MTTGPRTHFDVGLLIGGYPRWDRFSAPGTSATFTDNAVGGPARVKTGIVVPGWRARSGAGNDTGYSLVETNPLVTYAECPRVTAVVSPADASTFPRGQGSPSTPPSSGASSPPRPVSSNRSRRRATTSSAPGPVAPSSPGASPSTSASTRPSAVTRASSSSRSAPSSASAGTSPAFPSTSRLHRPSRAGDTRRHARPVGVPPARRPHRPCRPERRLPRDLRAAHHV